MGGVVDGAPAHARRPRDGGEGKAGAGEVIAACGLPENVRGETLDIAQFAAIANEIVRRKQNV